MRDSELREQLRQTAQLIDHDPTELILNRRTGAGVRSPAGGSRTGGAPEPRDPITVFFGAKTRDGLPLQDNVGQRVVQYYTIVANPGTDIQLDDVFTLNGKDYKVTFVHTNLPYEIKADVETVSGGYV